MRFKKKTEEKRKEISSRRVPLYLKKKKKKKVKKKEKRKKNRIIACPYILCNNHYRCCHFNLNVQRMKKKNNVCRHIITICSCQIITCCVE